MWKRQQTSRGRVITVHFSECDMDVSTSSGQLHTAPAPATQMELCLESEQSFGRGLPWWEPINQDPAECEPVMHTLIAAVQKSMADTSANRLQTITQASRAEGAAASASARENTTGQKVQIRWWGDEDVKSLIL